ncbi:MAG: hypothetical protein WC876_03675 [Candidatus Thermoplasmatota archaeon]|jgi:hypothetical protein
MMQSRNWVPVAGVGLAIAAMLQPVLAGFVEPTWASGLLAAMAAELVTGREAAIPLALATGVPPGWIALTSFLQNLALAALLVPAAVAGAHALQQRPGHLGRFLQRLHGAASTRLRHGRSAWVLFGFMLLPFVANGPVLAGVVGTLAGIRPRALIAALVAAVFITSIAWSFAYAGLSAALGQIHPLLAWLPALLAALSLLARVAVAARQALQDPLRWDA